MGLDNSKKSIFCIEKHPTFASSKGQNNCSRHNNEIKKAMKKRIIYVGTLADLAANIDEELSNNYSAQLDELARAYSSRGGRF